MTISKTLTALALVATVAGCTATPQMIAAQQDRCSQIGYAPGSLDHAQCVERGTMQQQQTQNAVTGSVAAGAANAAIWHAIWR